MLFTLHNCPLSSPGCQTPYVGCPMVGRCRSGHWVRSSFQLEKAVNSPKMESLSGFDIVPRSGAPHLGSCGALFLLCGAAPLV